jgi:carbon-monoxide dehydrogenase small subunit
MEEASSSGKLSYAFALQRRYQDHFRQSAACGLPSPWLFLANSRLCNVCLVEKGGCRMSQINVKVNGRAVSRQVEDRTLLVEFLRETLGLTGTHVGCDTGQCGACVVHLDGRAIKSCTMIAAQASGSEITTIEGLAEGDELHPMQAAFHQHHALQCGFCTPGMIMTAVDLLRRIPHPDEATIRANLDGNLCRCTGYHNIVKAIAAAAESGAGA